MEFLSGLTQALEGNFADSTRGRHPWVEQWLHLAQSRFQAGPPWGDAPQIWDFQDALESCAATLHGLVDSAQDEVEAELLRRAHQSVLSLVDCLDLLLEVDPVPDFANLGTELDELLAQVLDSQRALEQFSEARLDEQAGQGRSFRVSPEILDLHRCLQGDSRAHVLAKTEALRGRYREAARLLAEQGDPLVKEIEQLLQGLDELEGSLAEPGARQRAWDLFLELYEQLCRGMESR